ncbi:L-threonylcarbamoyladenylate synthase [Eupransor demetentiae]|uniref:Threonylcarbamoyl-AMP synthase n=1 Tax=Eupransor demetentiae TaxID=3109584 RepID=A0ABM9N5T0_9LACO|nr:tRNA A37 threonylcarbamoyladenosine synthetase subunit TsaC/SUA5/YrdC (TsaC) [Lactobacillaceae bacterium LMG 33000]
MQTKKYANKEEDLQEAAKDLRDGEVVAFPTETVYGLGADATNDEAVKKVFTAKGRPADNPLIMTVSDPKMLDDFVTVSPAARGLMANFWPGSLTIILPIIPDHVSMLVTGGLQTVAFRLPDNAVTRELISLVGKPLVGPSANTSGKPSPTTAQHVWHDMKGKIAGIVDDGPTQVGVESTVIDMSTDQPTILRTGAVTQEELEKVLGEKVLDATSTTSLAATQAPKAPGMKYRHYAPDKPVVMFDPLDLSDLVAKINHDEVVMGSDPILKSANLPKEQTWSLGPDVRSATEQLFAGLRYYDDQPNVTKIYVERMPEVGLGKAYNNRLGKASGNQLFQA